MKFYNVTFNLKDTRNVLIPSIPESAGTGENKTIKRVCLADTIEHCMQAVGRRDIRDGARFIVREVDIPLNKKTLLHPRYLKEHGYVPDALENNEYWSLEPIKCKLYICEIIKFDFDMTIAWSCITRNQVLSIIGKYTKTKSFERYKTSQGVYNAFCKWINKREYWDIEDSVWDELVELPWAYKTELKSVQYKVLKEIY